MSPGMHGCTRSLRSAVSWRLFLRSSCVLLVTGLLPAYPITEHHFSLMLLDFEALQQQVQACGEQGSVCSSPSLI